MRVHFDQRERGAGFKCGSGERKEKASDKGTLPFILMDCEEKKTILSGHHVIILTPEAFGMVP